MTDGIGLEVNMPAFLTCGIANPPEHKVASAAISSRAFRRSMRFDRDKARPKPKRSHLDVVDRKGDTEKGTDLFLAQKE